MFQKKLIVLALALSLPWTASSNIIISTLPVNGTGSSLGPNVMLDLSVEFPTAKTAYSVYTSTTTGFVTMNSSNRTTEFIGYFDPNKCYAYLPGASGYFSPVAAVQNTTNRTCAAGQWSGNVLNFGTMSAIDIFRSTMTGGNRALNITGTKDDYEHGDTENITTLRRSKATGGNFNSGPDIEINNVLSGMTPQGATNLRFYNTGWGFRLDASFNNGASWSTQGTFNAIVEVCKQNSALPKKGLETNCKPYTSQDGQRIIYKPEGMIQKYGTQMRFGAFGYLLDNTIERNGGVLRARMKYPALTKTTVDASNNNIVLGQEWNTTTGIYNLDPDTTDSNASGVENSGVINFVNKFGDANGYKTYDTAAEMFYASQRYFRKAGNPERGLGHPYTDGTTEFMKDKFPVITNWDDPLLGSCQKNFIIYIGDTNTWYDIGLPGLGDGASHQPPDDDSEFNTNAYLAAISNNEGQAASFYRTTNVGAGGQTPASIAALALWAHTNDIRPDGASGRGMPGKQTIDTFMIDVVEANNPKAIPPVKNSFYLAAKYGGFDTALSPDPNLPPRANHPSWTSDAPGDSRVPVYQTSGGTPDNFAQAQNPKNMVDALERAFSKISSNADATLASLSSNFKTEPTLTGSYTFQSAYDSKNWSGDLITRKIGFDVGGNMTQTEIWRAKNKYATQMASGWSSRNLFTLDRNTDKGADFTEGWYDGLGAADSQRTALDHDDGYGKQRVNFLRGDRTNETAGSTPQFRQRASLLGDIVNSSPAYIAAPLTDPRGCTYDNRASVLARDPLVAVAANDGLLHVFKASDGTEKFAYLPAAIFEKLPSLTAVNYQHDFYNDGSPQVQEICFTRDPETGSDYTTGARKGRSVLIGSTGVGGKAVYALDVTKPTIGKEDVLWEFSDKDDADMGLATSQPVTAYVRWENSKTVPVVIFGNGPNSTGSLGTLFILRLDKKKGEAWQPNVNYIKTHVRPDQIPAGTVINQPGLSTTKTWGTLPMQTTPNGLGGAVAVDHFGRGVADFVYAGDLNGNLWAFNLNGTLGGGSSALPISTGLMFVAMTPGDSGATPPVPAARQPITAAPLVIADPDGNCYDRVLIGTGQWYSNADNPIGQQTMYGLCTRELPGITASASAPPVMNVATLNEQTLRQIPVATNSNTSSVFYETSQNPVPADESWYLDILPNERVLQAPHMRGNQVARFDSVRPGNGTAGCNDTGESYITEVSLFTGAMINTTLFDTNGDGVIDETDMKASREKENTGVAGASLTLGGQQCNVGEKGVLLCEALNGLGTLGTRLSWRELLRN